MWPTMTATGAWVVSVRYGHEVVGLQIGQRRGDDAPVVGVARRVAVAGEVLEHRQQAGVAQPLGVGARELDDLRRIANRTSGRRSPRRRIPS